MIPLAALGAAILAAPIGPAPAAAAPVTWGFFETACTDLQRGSDCTPPQPFVLATLVLPGPTSAGSAMRGRGVLAERLPTVRAGLGGTVGLRPIRSLARSAPPDRAG